MLIYEIENIFSFRRGKVVSDSKFELFKSCTLSFGNKLSSKIVLQAIQTMIDCCLIL